MRLNTKGYVIGVAAAAVGSVAVLSWQFPSATRDELVAIAFFSALAVLAEMLSFVLARKARGSIAFIPYLAAVLVAPTWVAIVAVMLVKLAMEGVARINPLRAVFNASTHGLTLACAIGSYSALGGIGLMTAQTTDL